ncbi:MAG: TonB-dependent receptor, partial [Melioribacteraceae bacterium]|nr:TonB-dependent receptor [Melioribacteraceae bacterium]
ITFQNNGLIINAEGFYKTASGLSQFLFNREQRGTPTETIDGESRAYGIDLFLKQELYSHDFWISYTLSRTEENFSRDNRDEYVRSPHDQLHEFKGAAIFNFNPWYFSLNYVYGSGLYDSDNLLKEGLNPYHRLDLAILYKFNDDSYNIETGISIVNLFDYENIGYSGFSHLPGGERVYERGIPFTPSLFMNIGI